MRNTPCTPGGCYDRLKDVGGKILLVGVGHERNTYIHSVEEVLNVPNRLSDMPVLMKIVQHGKKPVSVYMRKHYNSQQPHISEDLLSLIVHLMNVEQQYILYLDQQSVFCAMQDTFLK